MLIRASEKGDLMWLEARLSGEFELFKKVAHKEISSLEKKGSWVVVKRSSVKSNILPSTWALKRKRYPNGRIRKYKVWFCIREDRQWYGLDYEEAYAPVAQWSMMRMMLTLTMKLGLRTKQVNYSNAFVQADIDGDVYCELPTEFSLADGEKSEYVLKLKKSLYGLKQAPLLWFKTLDKSLLDRSFKASKQDPCMFMKKGLVALVYMGDVLFLG